MNVISKDFMRCAWIQGMASSQDVIVAIQRNDAMSIVSACENQFRCATIKFATPSLITVIIGHNGHYLKATTMNCLAHFMVAFFPRKFKLKQNRAHIFSKLSPHKCQLFTQMRNKEAIQRAPDGHTVSSLRISVALCCRRAFVRQVKLSQDIFVRTFVVQEKA